MHLSYVPGNSVPAALVLVVMIDPKVVTARVNTLLSFKLGPGRQPMDGPVFTAMVEALVESLNEQLGALMNPVFRMPDIDDIKVKHAIDKVKNDARAVLMTHDEVVYDVPTKYDRVDALMHTFNTQLKAEPNLMKAWPTPKGPMPTSVAYRCRDRGCPPRAPISAQLAPTCYTCGKPMERA